MRRIVAVAAVAALAAGCTGASGSTSSDGGSPAAEEIRVMVSGDPEELEAYRQVADAYEAQGGGPVSLIEIEERDKLISRLATSIAAGNPPDLFLLNYRYYGQFLDAGGIAPVEDRLAASTGLDRDAFFPTSMAAFQDDGAQTCLPQNASSLVLYHNADLFEAAGLEPPPDDWTWDEMVAAARELTVDEDGDGATDVYGLGVDPELIRVAPFIWSNGGEVVDHDAAPTGLAMNTPEAAVALQAFIDLQQVEHVVPTEEEAESEDLETRFLRGGLAMMMESRKVVPTFRTIEDFDWDVTALPRFGDEPVSILHSDAYCMTTDAAHPDDAWRFLEFALGPEGQDVAARTGRTVPSLTDVASTEAFLTPGAEPSNSQVFLDQLATLRSVPHVAAYPQIEDAINTLLEEAFYEPTTGPESPELIAAMQQATEGMFGGG
ncbi:MAG TPA: sugar ABC transporter substrate-binding protein [Actinomycetota bacterium]|nr:sugar ABC transporter substrate-binding protein [Actinomycetota bacterium]